jgi:hypothetical protein
LAVRSLQAEPVQPGQMRYQLLVMQSGRSPSEFKGRYEIQLAGKLDGKPWTFTPPPAQRALALKQYARLEGMLDHPDTAVVESLQVRVLDSSGGVRASQTIKL